MFSPKRVTATATAVLLAGAALVPTAHAAETELAGSVDWNFKDSFLSYVTGTFAHGTVTASNGATWTQGQPFNFPINTAETSVEDNDTAIIALDGEVNFNAHGGVLNTTVSDFELHVNGTTGTLYVDYSSQPMTMGDEPLPAETDDNIPFVTINFDAPVNLSAPLEITGTTTLTEQGTPILSNYDAGEEFSDLVLNVDSVNTPEEEAPGDNENPGGEDNAGGDENPGSDDGDNTDNSQKEDDQKDSGSSNLENASSTEDGSILSKLFASLNNVVGLGAVTAIFATIIKHFQNMFR